MIKFMNFCNISVRWRSRYGVWPIAIPCLLLVLIIYHMLLPFYVFLLHYHDQLRIGAWSAQLSQTIALICPPPLFHLVHAIAPPFHLYLLFFPWSCWFKISHWWKKSLMMFSHSSFDCSISLTDHICILLLSRILIDDGSKMWT